LYVLIQPVITWQVKNPKYWCYCQYWLCS